MHVMRPWACRYTKSWVLSIINGVIIKMSIAILPKPSGFNEDQTQEMMLLKDVSFWGLRITERRRRDRDVDEGHIVETSPTFVRNADLTLATHPIQSLNLLATFVAKGS
jgi:hypothetical protein